jgi:hypothetical protein
MSRLCAPVLTRTSRSLPTARTGYARHSLAHRTHLRHRACPGGHHGTRLGRDVCTGTGADAGRAQLGVTLILTVVLTLTLTLTLIQVGPYLEYVTMGSVVTKRGALGQWGSRLYVSSAPAEAICKQVWGVPAETAEIEFAEVPPSRSRSPPP